MKGILRLAFKLLVNDNAKFTALLAVRLADDDRRAYRGHFCGERFHRDP